MDTKSNKRPRKEPLANKKRLVSKTIIYDESKPNQWLDDPPLEIWDHVIIPMLGLKDLALARHVCTFFEAYWQDKFSKNVLPLRVGNDVATIDQAMRVIEILSSRREYTKLNPLVVLLGKGNHQITSSWTPSYSIHERQTTLGITRSNITFLGKGKGITTILGGFGIYNVQNITFKLMTVTITSQGGNGIHMSVSNVELIDVALKECSDAALTLTPSLAFENTVVATRCEFSNSQFGARVFGKLSSATFKNCVFNGNSIDGINTSDNATIHMNGDATAIYSNGDDGIYASNSAKVIIHLPSNHNTSYNNTRGDRRESMGGTITNVED
jgi:hypothetical protein